MIEIFGPYSQIAWTVILAAALFFPVRQLVWVLSVRRTEHREGPIDPARRQALKRRAAFTAVLLCFVFAYFYTSSIMGAG